MSEDTVNKIVTMLKKNGTMSVWQIRTYNNEELYYIDVFDIIEILSTTKNGYRDVFRAVDNNGGNSIEGLRFALND